MTLTITDDRAAWDKLGLTLKSLDGAAVFAGIDDEELATRFFRHEFGEGVPERPAFAPAADEATPRALDTARRELGEVLDGAKPVDAALEATGEVFEHAIVNYVEAGRVGGGPLSKAAKRGDPRKLIDTGDMIKAVETIVARSIDGEDS